MIQSLYIPKSLYVELKIKDNCSTGKIGQVTSITYLDEGGTLREENICWDHFDLNNVSEFDNSPRNGFVINQEKKGNYHNTRKNVLCYHPEGFNFEISYENLLGLITETNIEEGLIITPCIFAYSNKGLLLIPENSILCEKFIKTSF